MSPNGWYEFYLLDDSTAEMSLALQFYKWGNAVPENAVEELLRFQDLTRTLHHLLPSYLVEQLIRESLESGYDDLPRGFSLGCYYFLLQRAAEELDPRRVLFTRWDYVRRPKEERPDYQLFGALMQAYAREGLDPPDAKDPIVAQAHFSIDVGRLIRRWEHCWKEMSFLAWIQYITQPTRERDMGSLAGSYERLREADFLYRFFFRVPRLDPSAQPVSWIGMEALSDRTREEDRQEIESWMARVTPGSRTSLAALARDYRLLREPMWEKRTPRRTYVGA